MASPWLSGEVAQLQKCLFFYSAGSDDPSSRRGARDDLDARTLSNSGQLNQAFGAWAKRSMERARESAGTAWTRFYDGELQS